MPCMMMMFNKTIDKLSIIENKTVYLLAVTLITLVAALTYPFYCYGETCSNHLCRIINSRPIFGIVLPSSPTSIGFYLSKLKLIHSYKVGKMTFYYGKLYHISVVISVPPPIGDFSYVSIDTYLLEKLFDPKFIVDPGTAGSHVSFLSMGDVLIGARIVNYTNYMTSRRGRIQPGEFSSLVTDDEGYTLGNPNPVYLYSDPDLVNLAYTAALQVAKYTPANILHSITGRRPWIVKYGTQGSGTIWFRDPTQIKQNSSIFHEDDEAGDFPIALISTENKIPFVEIHTISDSALNVPTKIGKYFHLCSVFAQNRSNKIVVRMIKMVAHGYRIVGTFAGGFEDPYSNSIRNKLIPPKYIYRWTMENGIKR